MDLIEYRGSLLSPGGFFRGEWVQGIKARVPVAVDAAASGGAVAGGAADPSLALSNPSLADSSLGGTARPAVSHALPFDVVRASVDRIGTVEQQDADDSRGYLFLGFSLWWFETWSPCAGMTAAFWGAARVSSSRFESPKPVPARAVFRDARGSPVPARAVFRDPAGAPVPARAVFRDF